VLVTKIMTMNRLSLYLSQLYGLERDSDLFIIYLFREIFNVSFQNYKDLSLSVISVG